MRKKSTVIPSSLQIKLESEPIWFICTCMCLCVCVWERERDCLCEGTLYPPPCCSIFCYCVQQVRNSVSFFIPAFPKTYNSVFHKNTYTMWMFQESHSIFRAVRSLILVCLFVFKIQYSLVTVEDDANLWYVFAKVLLVRSVLFTRERKLFFCKYLSHWYLPHFSECVGWCTISCEAFWCKTEFPWLPGELSCSKLDVTATKLIRHY